MNRLFINKKHLEELINIFKTNYPNSVIWAYGSRIKGTAHEGSDLDLVIVDYGQDKNDYLELTEIINQSNIPFLIDIFELKRLPHSFQEEIKRDYVVLYDGTLDSIV